MPWPSGSWPGRRAAAPAFWRLLKGPAADRVVALDLLFALAVAFCLLAALASGRPEFIDIAIGLALTGFVATLAWSRLVEKEERP